MHAIKGGWVGQTFALAKCNDSGEKKARIRRSKEERKAMVESFIKRYQNSNNGNFPSLNLTHKEVGGSFYIVREIVREIIQENRVLGPAKLSTEDHNNYSFLEQYPLGSISTEAQIHVLSSEEAGLTTNLHHSVTEKHVLDSNEKYFEFKHQRIKDDQANCIPVALGKDEEPDESSRKLFMPVGKENTSEEQFSSSSEQFPGPAFEQLVNKETMSDYGATLREELSDESVPTDALPVRHDETSIEQLQSCKEELPGTAVPMSSSDAIAGKSSQQSLGCKESWENVQETLGNTNDGVAIKQKVLGAGITQVVADVVETFPLRPVSQTIYNFNERSGESSEISNSLEEKEADNDRLSSLENDSAPRSEKGEATDEVLEVDQNKIIIAEKAGLVNFFEDANEATISKSDISEHSAITDLDKTSSHLVTKPVIAPNGIPGENLNTASTVDSLKQPTPDISTPNQNKPSVIHNESNSKKGISPTLNRINLETWEGKSRKSAGPETNPLVSLVKAFIAAFVKFWTE